MKIAIMGTIHNDGWQILKKNSFDVFEVNNFDDESLIKELANVDGVVLRTAKLNENVLSKCKNLKIVSRHGVGFDNVDKNYLDKNKIALSITGTANAVSVAEHVISMFLYLSRKIHLSNELTKSGNFTQKANLPDFYEIYKKNILIIGFGRIGQALSKRCKGFETNVYVYDPYVDKNLIIQNDCIPITKEEGLIIADYVSIHLPLNQNTKNFISFDELNIVKKNLILVNTSRGEIVNEKAVEKALKNRKIAGAGIDVFEKEPPINKHPFFKLDNIVLSPHNAALSLECRKRMSIEVCENILFYLNQKKEINKKNFINFNLLNFN